jgi:hypothetical protein
MPKYHHETLRGILIYTEDDSGNIYFVINKEGLTETIIEGQNLYTLSSAEFEFEFEFDISKHTACVMGDCYDIYLHRMTYDDTKKMSKQDNMELISYKELYESDYEIFTRDFRNKLTIALAEKIFT